MKSCENCERRDKHKENRCQVLKEKPEKCWAWTDDPDWEKKVSEQVKQYQLTR